MACGHLLQSRSEAKRKGENIKVGSEKGHNTIQKKRRVGLGGRLVRNFKKIKKLFWRDLNKVCKGKDGMWHAINELNRVNNRRNEYFEWLLKVRDDKEIEENCLVMGPIRNERNKYETISRKRVGSVLRKMK